MTRRTWPELLKEVKGPTLPGNTEKTSQRRRPWRAEPGRTNRSFPDEQRGRSPAAREEQDTGCKGWKKPAVLRDPCGIHTGGTEESPGEQKFCFEIGLFGNFCVCGKNARSSNNLAMLEKEPYIIQIQHGAYSYKYLHFRHVGDRLTSPDSCG